MDKINEISNSLIKIDLTPLCDKNAKLRDFVASTMHILLNPDLIPESEIQNLLDDDYGYETFELVAPSVHCALLTTDKERTKIKGNRRYGQECFGGKYYLCNEWRNLNDTMHEKAQRQRNEFYLWLKKIAEMNSKIMLVEQ
ncbi:MAG: hypothetical protein NC041_01625 [Bacteroides sp.]|nr:hypothetical protein [Prevotella sp.]MCM1407697.1 hypothetical protein [Treponema brennaborense]MCM1469153.1 hypothetical protein [Bacteroides sp.]